MPIHYLDYENGDDASSGTSWADAWKTLTLGATLARIAPGDIIRIAKSPAPSSIGNATWTNLSKIVTLASVQNLNIDLCETAWTGAGDTTIERTAVATDAKEDSYCMKLTLDAAVQASILQAYFATGELDLSAYQKISFWIKNSGAIVADNWIVNLCSDVAGATVVDSFLIPAIPSTLRWIPFTLTKEGGGNLGASIKSIAIYSGGTTTGMASKYIYVDDFIACTANGLNLQSLISKNSAEQGGAEGWYGIQSIDGVTVLLDNNTNTKGNAGRGYSTSGTTPETVTTYKRETIKTVLASASTTQVQAIMDSGSLAVGNIQFQGGYDITTNEQTGETFFDGLNGFGYGIYLSSKTYITLNYINVVRYTTGLYFIQSNNNTIITLSNANNNTYAGVFFAVLCSNNTIITLSNANNNSQAGVNHSTNSMNNKIITLSNVNNNSYGIYYYSLCNNNIITTLSNINNNASYGIYYYNSNNNIITTLSNINNNGSYGIIYSSSNNNIIILITNANNNVGYGIYFTASYNNIIRSLSTVGNTIGGVYCDLGPNYLNNALIAEGTEFVVSGMSVYANTRVYSNNHDQDTTKHWIYTDGGTINSVATDREGGTGIMWKLSPTYTRTNFYPLMLSVAKIACVADKLVTVKIYMKKDHATNVVGMLVCPGRQLTGMAVADIVATKTDVADTWEELEVTFTPTQAGVVEIEAWAYYIAGNANVYIEDLTIQQAD